jgi:hypothetical protein
VSFSQKPVRYRAIRGAEIGLGVGIVLCLWAAIVFAVKATTHGGELPITFRQTLIAYSVGAPLGGALAGIGAPLMKWALGAFFLGFMANFPVAVVGLNFVASDWPVSGRVGLAVFQSCIGGMVAVTIRKDPPP